MSTNQLDASKLIALFGHSVYHSDIDKAFEQFEVISPDKSKLKRYDSVNSASTGITFTFWYKVFYEKSINTPKSLFKSEDEEEVLLHEITFSLGKKWMCLLPYGLNWGDSSNEVIAKLDEKPFSKSKNYDGQNTWIFYKNDFKIMPVFDERLSLVWLRIWALQISDRKKIELKNDLKTQNKNIKQDNILELASLKNHKPTINWKIRMNEGDSIFTPIIIKGSEQILNDFLDNLITASKSKNASSIYSKVRKVINKFNKLNKNQQEFIDTLEREELVDFIERAVKLTGLTIKDGIDVTEDFREW